MSRDPGAVPDARLVPAIAATLSLLLGLFFIFVWAPHPWGWYGIDQYHQLAIELAQGRPFATLDVPWGYAYFLSVFYRIFGPTPLPVLLVQAVLNALIPIAIYAYASAEFDRRVASVAAVLVAIFSFNTVYVSTESTDAISTFLFVLMVWAFAKGRRRGSLGWLVLVGALIGLAAQFRPNLILLPFMLLALHWLMGPRTWATLRTGLAMIVVAALMIAPWVVRNYRLTREILPTSTHGGVQLWYGSLQTGAYLDSRAHNPRTLFETSAFDYTSLLRVPILFEAWMNCAPGIPESIHVVYRINDESPRRLALEPVGGNRYAASMPALNREARVYYYVEVTWPPAVSDPPERTTPAGGASDPFVYFVSTDHVGDLDVDHVLLDVFDVIRMARHIAWQEPIPAVDKLDSDRDGAIDESDLRAALRVMMLGIRRDKPPIDPLLGLAVSATDVRLTFIDRSTIVVPRAWRARITDIHLDRGIAENLLGVRHRFAQPVPEPRLPLGIQCLGPGEIEINNVFYRVQPHEQRRYVALALDNIRRDPLAYAKSVFYRAVRLFVVVGTTDMSTAQQFERSPWVYAIGTLASLIYLVVAVAGVWVGWRRGYSIWLPLALIVYIPATISFVLTNMRYTITVQPLLLLFDAVFLVAAIDRWWRPARRRS